MAYDATTGTVLWNFNVGSGISAPPITYSVDGKQYVSLLVGWGGSAAGVGSPSVTQHGWAYGVHPRRLITFSLTGILALPESPPPYVPKPIDLPDFEVDDDLAEQGAVDYEVCDVCHGTDAIAGGMAPDLRASSLVASEAAFAQVVRGGSKKENGMPEYAHFTDARLNAIRHYIRHQADLTWE